MNKGKLIYFIIIGSLFVALITTTLVLTFTKLEEHLPQYRLYDAYTLALYWNPATCIMKYSYNKTGDEAETCKKNLQTTNKQSLTIHGLWPTFYNVSIQMNYCNPYNDIDVDKSEISPDIRSAASQFWPGSFDSDEALWKHEFNKHGYCFTKRIKDKMNIGKYLKKGLEIFFLYNIHDFIREEFYMHRANEPDLVIGDFNLYKYNKTYVKDQINRYATSRSFNLTTENYVLHCLTLNETSAGQKIKVFSEIRMKTQAIIHIPYPINAKNYESCDEETFYVPLYNQHLFEIYDTLIFSLYWNTDECNYMKSIGEELGKRCQRALDVSTNLLTIHGMWPGFNNNTIPDPANTDIHTDPRFINIATAKLSDLYENMTRYWPSGISNMTTDQVLWEHEYNKHGIAFNERHYENPYEYYFYFNKTLNFFLSHNLQNVMIDTIDAKKEELKPGKYEVSPSDFIKKLQEKLGKECDVLLICKKYDDKTETLREVRFRLNTDMQPVKENELTVDREDKGYHECKETFSVEYIEKK